MNCKPGDLAMIVCDPDFDGADLWKLVEVLGDGYADEDGWNWACKSLGGPLLSFSDDDEQRVMRAMTADILDAWLRPIRPESEPETTEREVEHAA
mgnify:CR=1 FL=1